MDRVAAKNRAKKSLCFSRRIVSTPARARSRPSIIPAGPPPTMQHRQERICGSRPSRVSHKSPSRAGISKSCGDLDHARGAVTKLSKLPKTGDISRATVYDWLCARTGTKLMSQNKFRDGNFDFWFRMEQENVKILPVIMCGGSGTRVWPASREKPSETIHSLIGLHSTFQTAAETLADEVFETPIVLSNAEYRFLVAEQLQNINREARIVLEPVRRDSGPPSRSPPSLPRNRGRTRSSRFLAADHVVRDRERFRGSVQKGGRSGGAWLYRDPRHQAGRARHGLWLYQDGKTVSRMAACSRSRPSSEKPDAATAEKYVAGNYLWNSGNFFFSRRCDAGRIAEFRAEMAAAAAELSPRPKRI